MSSKPGVLGLGLKDKPDGVPRRATVIERRMLRLLAIAPFAFLIMLGGYALFTRDQNLPPADPPPLKVGKEVPGFTFVNLKGRQVSLSDYRGQVVFLNVWATWCVTCTWEMPSMETLHKRYRDQGLAMVTVSIDVLGKDVVVPYVEKLGLTFDSLLDPNGTVRKLYQVTGVPETFIIDRQGKLLEKIVGPREWTKRENMNLIELALRFS